MAHDNEGQLELSVDMKETSVPTIPKSVTHFENFVESTFINFMIANKLEAGSISNGCGEKAIVTTDKHGFYKVRYTKTKENL
jgi:hypothetical protein